MPKGGGRGFVARIAVVAVATVLAGALGMPSAIAGGVPDTTFGDGGELTIPVAGLGSAASTVAKSGSKYLFGGFVQGGGAFSRFALARVLTNGDPDQTFGGNDGEVVTDFFGEFAAINDLAVLGSGKILAIGYARKPNGNDVFAVARYRSNGQLDTTFSGDGKVVAGFGMDFASGMSLLTLSNGSFLLAGSVGPNFNHTRAAVAKFLPTGKLDTSFGGGDGLAMVRPPGSIYSQALSMESGGSGKIVIGGTSYLDAAGTTSDFLVARLVSDGRRDTSFSGDGIAWKHKQRRDTGNDLAVLPDGKILLAGGTTPEGSHPNLALLRFTAAGAFDASFGVTEEDLGESGYITALSVDGQGRLWCTGSWNQAMGLFRFTADGDEDGGIPIEFPGPDSPSSSGYAILTPGSKVLVVGSARLESGDYGFAAARLQV